MLSIPLDSSSGRNGRWCQFDVEDPTSMITVASIDALHATSFAAAKIGDNFDALLLTYVCFV